MRIRKYAGKVWRITLVAWLVIVGGVALVGVQAQTPTPSIPLPTETFQGEQVDVEATEEAIAIPPESTPETIVLGDLVFRSGLDCPEGSAALFLGAGDAFFAEENYSNAITLYTCSIRRDSSFARAYVRRGYAFFAQHADPEALADFNRALELDPQSAEAYNYRGMLYMTQGNFGLALGDFTVAVTLDPSYVAAFNNRGAVHAAEGNYDLALEDFNQAISADPDHPTAYAAIGAVYSALALDQYEQYLLRAGDGARLPIGEAPQFMRALAQEREVGAFAAWLALLVRE